MAKIERKKIEVAQRVLAEVEKRINKDVASWHYVHSYSNGREQGLHIAGGDRVISFSEYRSSDGIVVYVGNRYTFSMQGNIPDEEAYRNKTFFRYDEHVKAGKFIAAILKENWKKYKMEQGV